MTTEPLNHSVEERLAAVEAAVAKLQTQVAAERKSNWLEQITGAFENDPVFEEILQYGRAYRESTYPDYCKPEA